MTDISNLIRTRNRCLALAATAYLVWQGMQLLEDILPEGMGSTAAIMMTGMAGIVGFIGATLMFLVYAGRVKKGRAQEVIQDELFAFNQAKALRVAYIALMVVIAAAFVMSDFMEIPSDLFVRILMMVGVSVPIFAFLVLDRDAGEEDEAFEGDQE